MRDNPMERRNGLHEGIARGLSQACVYGLEAQKTMIQVFGKTKQAPLLDMFRTSSKGMLESALTAGMVFGAYFSIYNSIGASNILAGPISTFATSFIKIPIANSMRLLHAGMASNVLSASIKLVKAHKVRGLYSGYTASVLEDLVELDMRIRLYQNMRNTVKHKMNTKDTVPSHIAFGMGALSSMIAAWVTTPFDTIRANMAIQCANKGPIQPNVLFTAQHLYSSGGVQALYRGARFRTMSNGVKGALFYVFLEFLDRHVSIQIANQEAKKLV